MLSDRARAAQWAAQMLDQPGTLILDTETTGLAADSEICEIAIITTAGQVVLDKRIRPLCPIEAGAAAIHGITAEQLASAPTFDQLVDLLRERITGANVVIYNADFDMRMLVQSAAAHGIVLDWPIFGALQYHCAMHHYAAWYGDWNQYYGNYRWQPLPGGDHSALGDALATLRVLQRMAGRDQQ